MTSGMEPLECCTCGRRFCDCLPKPVDTVASLLADLARLRAENERLTHTLRCAANLARGIVQSSADDEAGAAVVGERIGAYTGQQLRHAEEIQRRTSTRWSALASRLLAAVGVDPAREDGGTDDEAVRTVEAVVGRWRAIETAAQAVCALHPSDALSPLRAALAKGA